jgi:hypothetical protein
MTKPPGYIELLHLLREISMDTSKAVSSPENANDKADYFMPALLCVAIAGFIWFMASGSWRHGNEIRHVFDVEVQGRGCVVAAMENKRPSTYRCDKPVAGQYVDADKLWADAKAIVAARYPER